MDAVFRTEAAHIWQFLKSGILTLLVYYSFYLSLNELGVWYIYSSWFASFSSSICTFLLQKYYVFSEPKKIRTRTQVLRFIVLTVVGRVANSTALYYLVEDYNFSKTEAQVTLTCVTAFFAYIAFRFWVFKEK